MRICTKNGLGEKRGQDPCTEMDPARVTHASGSIDLCLSLICRRIGCSIARGESQPPRMGWAEGVSPRLRSISLSRSTPSSRQAEVSTEMNSVLPVKHGIYGLAEDESADWRTDRLTSSRARNFKVVWVEGQKSAVFLFVFFRPGFKKSTVLSSKNL